MDITTLPPTNNSELVNLDVPKRLTLEQFNELAVSEDELELREKIYALESMMFSSADTYDDKHLPEIGVEPIHRFVNGLYHRELTIPPNRVIVGKRHAIEHIVMLTAGSCMCVTERGIEHMVAPMTFISPAGEKRVVVTGLDESCTWVTRHPTNETDLEKIEDDVIIAEPLREAEYKELHRKAKEQIMIETINADLQQIAVSGC